MKSSLTLSLLIGITALFQGCGSTPEDTKSTKESSVTLSGASTLKSSRFDPEKATVCLDENSDNICNEDEPQSLVNDIGEYKIIVKTKPKDGTMIIATGGYSLLLRDDQNRSIKNVINMHKSYHQDENSANVNIMSHVVYLDMKENGFIYQESLKNIQQRYNYSTTSILLEDPIRIAIEDKGILIDGPGVKYYYNAIEIEKFIALQITTKSAKKVVSRTEQAVIEEDTIIPDLSDLIIDTTLFDSYLDDLTTYFNDFWNYLFGEETTDPQAPDEEEQPSREPQLVEIQRDHLNGIWYIIDASGDKTCSDIRFNNDIAVTEADGGTTDLTLTYDNTKKTMLLKLGFFTADTIKFSAYYDNQTFNGNYESDGETLSGYKMDSLAACKSEKLEL